MVRRGAPPQWGRGGQSTGENPKIQRWLGLQRWKLWKLWKHIVDVEIVERPQRTCHHVYSMFTVCLQYFAVATGWEIEMPKILQETSYPSGCSWTAAAEYDSKGHTFHWDGSSAVQNAFWPKVPFQGQDAGLKQVERIVIPQLKVGRGRWGRSEVVVVFLWKLCVIWTNFGQHLWDLQAWKWNPDLATHALKALARLDR
jgi:hypothetical protein